MEDEKNVYYEAKMVTETKNEVTLEDWVEIAEKKVEVAKMEVFEAKMEVNEAKKDMEVAKKNMIEDGFENLDLMKRNVLIADYSYACKELDSAHIGVTLAQDRLKSAQKNLDSILNSSGRYSNKTLS